MNADVFEKHLQHQPLRQVPAEWRGEILAAARQASAAQYGTRNTQHVSPTRSLLGALRHQFSTLLWPHPAAWAGLAAVWLVILGLNHTTRDAMPRLAKGSLPAAPQLFMAFQEQERLLTELIGPRETPVAQRPKPAVTRPRSELRHGLLRA